jgi:hypothetical protein
MIYYLSIDKALNILLKERLSPGSARISQGEFSAISKLLARAATKGSESR